MCLTRMEELESCLSGLLSTLKKNREHVPLEVLKTQYKQPYEELVRNINLTASAYAKSVLLHRLVLNPDADVEEQCTVINQMIQTSGMLKKKHGLRPACRKLPGLNREKTWITPRLSQTSGAQQRKNTDYAPLVTNFSSEQRRVGNERSL